MSEWLLALSVSANLVLLGVVHDLITELRNERKRAEIEAMWADQHRHEADEMARQLGNMRRQYAVLQWLHEGTGMLEMSAAWRAGVGVKKGVRK
jgi:uncharacterized membrane protein YeiB